MVKQIISQVLGVIFVIYSVIYTIFGKNISNKLKKRCLRNIVVVLVIILGLAYIFIGIWSVKDNQDTQEFLKNDIKEIKNNVKLVPTILQVAQAYKDGELKKIEEDKKRAEIKLTAVAGIVVKVEGGRPIEQKENLKVRAFSLSSQLIQFLLDRYRNEPPLPTRIETFKDDANKFLSYFQDTANQYSLKFGSKVATIRNEFASKGLRDKELDKYYEHPNNPIEVRIIAERIQVLAEKIP